MPKREMLGKRNGGRMLGYEVKKTKGTEQKPGISFSINAVNIFWFNGDVAAYSTHEKDPIT